MAQATIIPTTAKAQKNPTDRIPPLETGDELSLGEFLRRYQAMPELKKAELVQGIVFPMASPVSITNHAKQDSLIQLWIGTFAANSDELETATNATVKLSPKNVFQPDALLRRTGEGATSTVDEVDNYLSGAPELVAEIASSSVSTDAGKKKKVYLEAGVTEYLLWRVDDGEIDWFHNNREEGEWEQLETNSETGCIESLEFPGLVLNLNAALSLDSKSILETLTKQQH